MYVNSAPTPQNAQTHKQLFIARRLLPTNYLSVFDHFVGLALRGLILPHSWSEK